MEIARRMHKEEMRSWLQPKSGDLLRDVIHLQGRAAKEVNKTARLRVEVRNCADNLILCSISNLQQC